MNIKGMITMAFKDSRTRLTYPAPGEWQGKNLCQGKISDYKPYNFVDGEGVRCSLYVSGCPFACPGCYNKKIQSFHVGVPYTAQLQDQILEDLSASYCQGLTLLGGEPMLSTPILIPLCQALRQRFGREKDIWSWTGYTWEELMQETEDKKQLLSYIDVLIDGRYDQRQRDLSLRFRGSRNQRIIDVAKSLVSGTLVLWSDQGDAEEIAQAT